MERDENNANPDLFNRKFFFHCQTQNLYLGVLPLAARLSSLLAQRQQKSVYIHDLLDGHVISVLCA